MSKALVEEAVYQSSSSSQWIRISCPWCGSDNPNKTNMSVSQESSYYCCHRCGEKGFYKPFIPTLENLQLRLHNNTEPAPEAPPKPTLPREFKPLYHKPRLVEDQFFWDYIVGRGVHPDIFTDFNVGYCATGFYGGSIVVPFWDKGELVGFVARNLTDRQYRYPKGFRRELCMFNMDRLLDEDPVVVVEGVFDAMPHAPHAVAVLGKPTHNHISMIVNSHKASLSGRKVFYLMLDGDARSENWATVKILQRKGVPAFFVKTPSGKDPGDLSPEQFYSLIDQGMQ